MTPAAVLWARSILRRSWRSTILLTLFAGLLGTAVLTAWEYSRRADTVIARRLERQPLPDSTLQSCPPGVDPAVDPTECLLPANNLVAYEALRRSEHQVGARVFAAATIAVTGAVGGRRTTLAGTLLDSNGALGNGYFIHGRAPDPDDVGEVSVSELTAATLGVRTGDELSLDACASGPDGQVNSCDDHTTVRVSGITRSESDLVPQLDQPDRVELTVPDFGIMVSRAWFTTHAAATSGYVTTNFRLAPGSTVADVRADLDAALPGWTVLLSAYEDSPRFTALRRSTSLLAHSLELIAGIVLLAGLLFVGQTLARQVRRELSDRGIVVAMGAGTRLQFETVAIRFAPVVTGAASFAAIGALVLSGSGPTGIAGRAEVDPGFRFDAVAVIAGSVLYLFVLVAIVGTVTGVVVRNRSTAVRRVRHGLVSTVGMPSVRVGARGFSQGLVVAAAGTIAAIACVVIASTVGASLERVDANPARYGAPWDYAIGIFDDPAGAAAGVEAAKADPFLTDLSLVTDSGPLELPGVPTFSVVSVQPQRGSIAPVIVAGRAPGTDDEIALGPLTMRAMGLRIGDTLPSLPTLVGEGDDQSVAGSVGPFTVVGEALVGAVNPSVGPGNGVIVTEAVRSRIDTAVSPYLVARVDSRVPRRRLLDHLVTAYGTSVSLPGRQDDLRNLDRIASAPWVIAGLVAALAIAAVGHALVTTVRRRRREMAVLRSLGFTSRQVVGALAVRAVLVAATAVSIGVPLGVVAGRWAWRLVTREIGLAAGPVVVVGWIVIAATAAFVVLLVASLGPAISSARMPLVDALRAE